MPSTNKSQTVRARVLFDKWRRPDNNWAIVNMRQEEDGKPIKDFTAVGVIPHCSNEEMLDLVGGWTVDPNYGEQFTVTYALRVRPVTAAGMEKYLADVIDGVGPSKAKKLLEHFGFGHLQAVLDYEPERLTEIKGINASLADRIHKSWKSDNDPLTRQVGFFLASHGVSNTWTHKIISAFGAKAVDIITENPYKLTRVEGISFSTADAMAQLMGYPPKSANRTEACFIHCLYEALKNGHVCLPDGLIIEQVMALAKVSREEVVEALDRVVERGELKKQVTKDVYNTYVYLYIPRLYQAEKGLARRIRELVSYDHDLPAGLNAALENTQLSMKRTFSPKQVEAIRSAFSHHVNIVTGGPGTGKTTIVETIIRISHTLNIQCVLAAPTGRAARRLSELADFPASTIHKLLGYDGDNYDWLYHRNNPIQADILLIDESSMLDVELAYRLVDAVPDHCSVVFVGDVDQLPSVGPGQVLGDLIKSKRVQVTILDTVFRQAEDSLIVRNSHKIRKGEMPMFPPGDKTVDTFFIPIPRTTINGKSGDDVAWMHDKLKRLLTVNLPEKYPNMNMLQDVQVLAPMRKGTAGIHELNKSLQEALNPGGCPLNMGDKEFRLGDRVMQTKNNYVLDVSNGDIGFIRSVDPEGKVLYVEFYGRMVEYPFRNLPNLDLAYAQTIHKSQGSEFPIVIIIMCWQHSVMLERNLLYTANTRAKQMALYLASKGAVEKAAKTCETKERFTFLVWRLCHGTQEKE